MSTTPYRFSRFSRELLAEDMAFRGGPGPGSPFPAFELVNADGEQVRSDDLIGDKPVLLEFSSFT